jgi:ParB family transcriptional regulator, chromosome partitioning protein
MRLEAHQLKRRWEDLGTCQPESKRRLMTSLAANGQQTPIVVVATDQPDQYEIIDGYKRIAALQQLGRDTVEAVVWPLTTTQALVLARTIQMSARLTALEEGWLLTELEEHCGYGLQELARQFDRSAGWVTRRLALVERLPKSVQQQVREGKITAHVATKYLAPIAEVSLTDCQRMADAFARHRFNSRQAGELYAAWRKGGPVLRQRLVEQPELFLKAKHQSDLSPPRPTPASELRHDLEMIAAISTRAHQRAPGAFLEMNEQQCQQARRQIDRAIEELKQVAAALCGDTALEEKPYVEQRSTDGDPGACGSGSEPPADSPGDEDLAPHGAPHRWFKVAGSAGAAAAGEGRGLSPGDPRSGEEVQGEHGPGP